MKALLFIIILIGSIQSAAGYFKGAELTSTISNLAESWHAQLEKSLRE